jgi:NAD(P)-dependent dehydrogenase (short-subunit alcohol dehydrogenase family)
MEINNKTAVVTGGGNGIGKALCVALAEAGANVVIADIELDAAEAVKAEISATGAGCLALAVDVTDEGSVNRMRDAAQEAFGSVDILVNNAGVMHPTKPLFETSSADLEWVMSVNVGGVMNGIRAFVPLFIEQGTPAWILNTASEHSLGVPHLGGGLYTASKHAVLGLSDVLRRELPEHIGVSVLCPGIVGTTLWKASERRQDRYGGAEAGSEQAGAAMQHIGMPVEAVAQATIRGLGEETFFIVTHPHAVAFGQARWSEIESAFATQAPRFEGDEKYDLNKLLGQITGK